MCGGSFPFLAIPLILTSGAVAVTTEICTLFCLLPWGPALLPTGVAPPHPWLTLVFLRYGGDSLLTLVWGLTAPGRAFSGSHPARLSVTSPSFFRGFSGTSQSFLYFLGAESPGLGQGTLEDIHLLYTQTGTLLLLNLLERTLTSGPLTPTQEIRAHLSSNLPHHLCVFT